MADSLPTKLNLDVVTPKGPVFSTQVDWVTASGSLGDVGILPGHVPMLSALKAGNLSFKRQGEIINAQTGEGFIEIGPNRVIVLVDEFERGEAYALRAILDWQTQFEAEQMRNAIARADTKARDLEAKGLEKSEEYQQLNDLMNTARTRLEKR
jgi:F-type H+-transporting ATPase subunit epsilon